MKFKRKILTAKSSHKRCFICNRPQSYANLKIVKPQTISKAYQASRIYIKPHARCCKIHFDENYYIKPDLYEKIHVKNIAHKTEVLMMLDSFLNHQKTIYDGFKNINDLNNEYCLKITGWTKDQFLKFSSYIKNIKKSKGRTKYQLIALYRYWLRKGIDQTSLATLFSSSTNQQKISHYLNQIRNAIYEDFVPKFLGVNNTRDFYLKHNNSMTKELHELDDDILAVFVDGTYCRLEKSSNNNFQYNCWSEQKMDLLTKPFIICCADGYIIDCYGPFQANKNDAKIFKYILETDNELHKILLPLKTAVFLDRGFRDIFNLLKEDYKFLPMIPTCQQLKQFGNDEKINTKQLSVKETAQNRMVTKCRFIIEKVNGDLKNFKALDNIRNTQAGHIQIDYRNSCAMLNFFHKPCCPDKNNSLKIAKRLKEKAKISINPLEFLLKKHFDTKMIKPLKFNEINDFPNLSEKTIIQRITLGSFQLSQCKSYVIDLIKEGRGYLVSKEMLKKNNNQFINSKIIGFEIISRHKRSEQKLVKCNKLINHVKKFKKTYKIFIQYIPNNNSSKSIKGYICSCKSGLKQAGCCAHVATIIFYFGFARKKNFYPPAEHLNSIFIDMNNKQAPNKPKLVKNKRNKIQRNIGTEISSSEESETEVLSAKKSNFESQIKNNDLLENDFLNQFKIHIPKWGGLIKYKEFENIKVTNTCTIDYFLLALWLLYKKNSTVRNEIMTLNEFKHLYEIIIKIDELEWNKAKEIWINKIMQYDKDPVDNCISLFGSESKMFLDYLSFYQKHQLIHICDEKCTLNEKVIIKEDSINIFFKKVNQKLDIFSCYSGVCHYCDKKISTKISFIKKPSFIFIQSAYEDIKYQDLPQIVNIDNSNYELLCTTLHKPNHFISIFNISNRFYVVDDLKKKIKCLPLSNKKVIKNKSLFGKLGTTVSVYQLNLL